LPNFSFKIVCSLNACQLIQWIAQLRLLHTPQLAMLNPNAVQLPSSTRFPGDFPQVHT